HSTRNNTLSLHDALPISGQRQCGLVIEAAAASTSTAAVMRQKRITKSPITYRLEPAAVIPAAASGLHRNSVSPIRQRVRAKGSRSEEHTSELQSLAYLVC